LAVTRFLRTAITNPVAITIAIALVIAVAFPGAIPITVAMPTPAPEQQCCNEVGQGFVAVLLIFLFNTYSTVNGGVTKPKKVMI
jgi:hypothetical protein